MERRRVVKVSVILPTYNRSASLLAAMNSVLTQSEGDLELIVVDDCSTDGTESLVQGIADPRVRFVRRQQNGGAAAARNTGLALATGQFIAFQDSDDLWLPGKLLRQLQLMSSLPEDVGAVTGGKILYGRDDTYRYGAGLVAYAPKHRDRIALDGNQLAAALKRNPISLQNTLFRADCYTGREWFDPLATGNEDWDFSIRLVQRTRIYEDAEPVVLSFISPDSISRNTRKTCMGLVRILRKNRVLLERFKRERSAIELGIARSLHRMGKPRLGRGFFLRGLRDDPRAAFGFIEAVVRRLRNAVNKVRADG